MAQTKSGDEVCPQDKAAYTLRRDEKLSLILHGQKTGHTTIKMTATVIYNLMSLQPDFLPDPGPSGARWDVGYGRFRIPSSSFIPGAIVSRTPISYSPVSAAPATVTAERESTTLWASCSGVLFFSFYLTLKAIFISSPAAWLGDCLL